MALDPKAVAFFFEHAGYSVLPGESEIQGKISSAIAHARAERKAANKNFQFGWSDEVYPVNHVKEFPDAYDEEPDTCEQCVMYNSKGHVIAAMGCIDDATPEYRRVVEAELALSLLY